MLNIIQTAKNSMYFVSKETLRLTSQTGPMTHTLKLIGSLFQIAHYRKHDEIVTNQTIETEKAVSRAHDLFVFTKGIQYLTGKFTTHCKKIKIASIVANLATVYHSFIKTIHSLKELKIIHIPLGRLEREEYLIATTLIEQSASLVSNIKLFGAMYIKPDHTKKDKMQYVLTIMRSILSIQSIAHTFFVVYDKLPAIAYVSMNILSSSLHLTCDILKNQKIISHIKQD